MSANDDRRSSTDDVATSETVAAGSAGDVATGETVAAGSADSATVLADLPVVDSSYYTMLAEHGRGGLGRIVRARDRRTGRVVAIKEVLSGADHTSARFTREALVTANLQHPSIVPVYEVGRWGDGQPFYAMKLVSGRDLYRVIKETEGFEQRLALLPHLTAVAEALAYAHSERIIHRDLKPANVLVGAYGETVVIDWGLAKDLSSAAAEDLPVGPYRASSGGLTQVGAIMGTPAYMPPEQARGEPVDERCDVYALGAMLYHLLIGRMPYADSTSAEQVLSKVLAGPPAAIENQVPSAPPDLIAIVDKAMARDPDQRYRNAGELADDLRRFQTGKLVGAHQYSTWQLVKRWLGRHRGAVAVAAIAALLLAAIGGFSVQRIRRERDTARAASARAEAARTQATRRLSELFAEQGRQALAEHRAGRAATLLAQAYALGDDGASLRMLLARALVTVEARARAPAIPGSGTGYSVAEYSPDGSRLLVGEMELVPVLWDTAAERPVAELERLGGIIGAQFSPTGERIFMVGADHRVHLTDAANGAVLWSSAPFGEGLVSWVSFTTDGARYVAVSPQAGRLIVGDAIDGGPALLEVEQAGASSAAFDRTGNRLFVATTTGEIVAMDLRGKRLGSFATGNRQLVQIGVLRDGSLLVRGERGIQRWDPDSERRISELASEPDLFLGMLVSADEKWALVWGTRGAAHLWSIEQGAVMGSYLGHSERIDVAGIAMERQQVMTAAADGTVIVWDALAQSPLFVYGRIGANPQGVALDPSSERVALADHDEAVRVIDYGAYKPFLISDAPALQPVSIGFSPDGEHAAIGAGVPAAQIIDARTGKRVAERPVPAKGPVYVEYARDSGHIAVAGADAVAVFAPGSSEPSATIHGVTSMVAIAPDGSQIASGSKSGAVTAYDTATGAQLWSRDPFDAEVSALAYSPDGRFVFAGSHGGDTALLATEGGAPTPLTSHVDRARGVRFAPDSSMLVSVGLDDAALVSDVPSGKLRFRLGKRAAALAMFPNGDRVATGHLDGGIAIWDTATGQQLAAWNASAQPIVLVDVAPDGQRLVSSAFNGGVAIWDARDGTELMKLPGHQGTLVRPLFSPDGERVLAVADGEARARLWDVHLESRSPDEVQRLLRCASGWKMSGVKLVPADPAADECP